MIGLSGTILKGLRAKDTFSFPGRGGKPRETLKMDVLFVSAFDTGYFDEVRLTARRPITLAIKNVWPADYIMCYDIVVSLALKHF
jgi:hypothetical protein